MTVEEALSCPWLHSLTAPSSQPLNLLVVDRLLHFVGLTPLQRLLLNLAISCQPAPNPRKHLRRLFNDLVSHHRCTCDPKVGRSSRFTGA
jgi:hypothetical protein